MAKKQWRSGLAGCSRGRQVLPLLNAGVSLLSNRFIQPMVFSPAFTFASIHPLGVLPCAGLCLSWLRRFQAFSAASACAESASSYYFVSLALPQWRSAFSRVAHVAKLGLPVLASGSNSALEQTRILRAAYPGC